MTVEVAAVEAYAAVSMTVVVAAVAADAEKMTTDGTRPWTEHVPIQRDPDIHMYC